VSFHNYLAPFGDAVLVFFSAAFLFASSICFFASAALAPNTYVLASFGFFDNFNSIPSTSSPLTVSVLTFLMLTLPNAAFPLPVGFASPASIAGRATFGVVVFLAAAGFAAAVLVVVVLAAAGFLAVLFQQRF
jgi:hypothetical protein